MTHKNLNNIIFISLPKGFQSTQNSIKIDPSILLPVELKEGSDPSTWDIKDLSWEMILSGMLKVLAYTPEHKDASYFRKFILAFKPEIVKELTQSAIIKQKSQDFILAKEILLALKGLLPEDHRTSLNLAIFYENQATFETKLNNIEQGAICRSKAEEIYNALIEYGQDLPDIYFNASWFYFTAHDFTRAHTLASSFISFSDDDVKINEAKKIIQQCEDLSKNENQYTKAFRLISEDKNQEGLEEITSFLESNKTVWNAWFLKGWAERKLGLFPQGLASFKEAEHLHPGHSDTFNEMAICSLEQNNFKDAKNYLQQALELDPESIKVISNMGILALKQNNLTEAKGFFNTVLAFEPDDLIAKEYLDFIEKKEK